MREWVKESRKHQFTNSYTTIELRDYASVNYPEFPKYIGRGLFNRLIHAVNTKIAEKALEGHCVTLPMRMGYIEIRKKKLEGPKIVNGKLVVCRPINWADTLKLWEEDEEARKKKMVIKREDEETFFIYYNKYKSYFKNRDYVILKPAKAFVQELYRRVKEGKIEAPEIKRKPKKRK